jgi:hypothetical protein
MALALAITVEPARLNLRLDVTGIPAGADRFTITRTAPSGNTAGVRGAVNAKVRGNEEIARDWEAPFDIPLFYEVTAYDNGTAVGHVAVTYTVPFDDCEVWLVDLARPTNSVRLNAESLDALDYAGAVGVHHILNRRAPVLTTLPSWTPSGELQVITETLAERDAVRALLGSGYPFLLRSTPDMGFGNIYFGVNGFVEERFISLGWAPQRRFRIAAIQVERPDPEIFTPEAPNTYAHVFDQFASYAALRATVGTYDALAYTFEAGVAGPVIPWLPSDV